MPGYSPKASKSFSTQSGQIVYKARVLPLRWTLDCAHPVVSMMYSTIEVPTCSSLSTFLITSSGTVISNSLWQRRHIMFVFLHTAPNGVSTNSISRRVLDESLS